jgi:ubiquitin carboxyl-terminal hydrolase L3
MTFNWPPLESNPEVFTEFMQKCGLASTWGFSELYGFDEDLLGMVPQPVVAVILNAEHLKKNKEAGQADFACEYYMKQTSELDNACGVIACFHSIFNNKDVQIEAGSKLEHFFSEAKSKNAQERATFMENYSAMQEEHKDAAGQGQSAQAEDQSDVRHHFTAFVVVGGKLVEFDGMKVGPHVIKEESTDCLKDAAAEIQRRLADGEISEQLSVMTLNAL